MSWYLTAERAYFRIKGDGIDISINRSHSTDDAVNVQMWASELGQRELANARLIAAAPELLAACEWVAKTVRHKAFCPAAENRGLCDCGLQRNVVDAIAKARGEQVAS